MLFRSEDSFNNFIQEGGQLPLNPTSTRLNVLPRAYEEQFNNVTQATPQVSQSENINTTNNDFVDFGNGITLPKELLPEEKTKEEFNNEVGSVAKTFWQESFTQKGIKIPAGINMELVVDSKSHPTVIRSMSLKPPDIVTGKQIGRAHV